MSDGVDIRVWFCSTDADFGGAIGRALGPGFETKLHNVDTRGWEKWCDCILLDLRILGSGAAPDPGIALLDKLRKTESPVPIVVLLGDDDPVYAQKLSEAGAYDSLVSPLNIVELRLVLRRAHRLRRAEEELVRLRAEQASSARLGDLIGFTENMQQVFALARKVARCDVTVLITGETGTGKTMLAQAIHRLSPRAVCPFVSFSCANLPENLVEDELFGHEKGAFTGAVGMRQGRFEAANQGTLFMDEIGDLPLGLQAKLLRVLQERTFERLGSNASQTANIRLICATHRNLEEMVERDEFREDLYYRLNVIQLHLPPLRERNGAASVLSRYFLQNYSRAYGKRVDKFSRLALRAIEEYPWPGNVRELENVVQRAVILTDASTVELQHLPAALGGGFEQSQASQSYEGEVRNFKRRLVARTLRECGGNKAETARALGLARGYLHRLINELEIHSGETSTEPIGEQDEEVAASVM